MAELARVIRGLVFVLGTMAVVTACGGGGSSAPADVDPEPITLELETGTSPELEPGEAVETAPVTITGINRSIAVSVSGGEYSIDGGEYTSAEGTISNGQTIQLRAPASSNYEETVTITLTLGEDTVETFQVTTRAKDETPETFSFIASTSQELGASVNSNAITITGIDPAVALSVENGSYSLDNGTTFETADTTIDADQTIILQGTASSSYETTETVSLTVGTESASFSITTRAKDTTPTAFEFTPATEQEINTSIDSNTVTITGIDPETEISIENGTYSLDGGETFTDAAATINTDQEVIVRLTTSGDYESDATATLTVGTESQNFVATTRSKDTTPDPFSILSALDVELDTDVSSIIIAVDGFDPETEFSVAGGSYSIFGDNVVITEATTIDPGQEISLTGRSSSAFETTTTVSVTVGTVTEDFLITTRARDITPENLEGFQSVTDGDPNTAYTSNTITVADIEGAVNVSVSAGAAYDINESGVFVSEAGTIESGQTVRVQATTSAEFDTPVVATLTVGTEERTFSVTALEDTTPEVFGLNETASEVEMESEVSRGPLTISGINTTTSISIENGEYEIVGSGDGFVSTEGSIEAGAEVNVRATAPADANATLDVALTVGTLTETLTIETLVDETAPTVSVLFPPPVAMTEGDTVTIRGTATDEVSEVSDITIIVGENSFPATVTTTVTEEETITTWVASVTLAEGNNTLQVSATDSVSNTEENAASVMVKRDSGMGDFPNSDNPLVAPFSMVYDTTGSNNRLIIADQQQMTLITVDFETGERTTFSDVENEHNEPMEIRAIYIDEPRNRLLVGDQNTDDFGNIYQINLDSGAISEFSTNVLFPEYPFLGPNIFIKDPRVGYENHILMGEGGAVMEVNISGVVGVDGQRDVFSSAVTFYNRPLIPEDGANPWGAVMSMVSDGLRGRLITANNDGQLISVDIDQEGDDGARIPFSNNSFPNSSEPFLGDYVQSLILDGMRNQVIAADISNQRLVSVVLSNTESETEGVRSLFSTDSIPNSLNPISEPRFLLYEEEFGWGYVLVADSQQDAIIAVDLETGERVFFTRGVTP